MIITPEIKVNNKIFKFIKRRSHRPVSVYRSGGEFMRLGESGQVKKEFAVHKKLLRLKFPVAAILKNGKFGKLSYYTEKSLGEDHFGHIFRDDYNKSKTINRKNFALFLKISEKFAEAQLATTTNKPRLSEFFFQIHKPEVFKELPQYKKLLAKSFHKIQANLKNLPFVLSHGDFNPHNIYPKGVTDLETFHYAPLGYDIVTNITQISFFPLGHTYEFYRGYYFSTQQRQQYFALMDNLFIKHGYKPISEYKQHFIMCRAVWSVVRMDRWPKIQHWRYKQFKKLLENYLANKPTEKILL